MLWVNPSLRISIAELARADSVPDSVLELIYLEYVLSQETPRPLSPAVLLQRFPEYQSDLQKILSVDHVFAIRMIRRNRTTQPSEKR